jgi:hypothetical protein
VRFVGRAEDRGSTALARTVTVDDVRTLLARQAARAFPITAGDRLLFTGTAGRLAFPILRPPGQGPAGLVLAVFDIEATEGGSRLVYREYPFRPGAIVAVAERPTRSTVMAATPFALAFSYRGGTPEWTAAWNPPGALPQLVRLAGGDWPDLIVRLRAQPETGLPSPAAQSPLDAPGPMSRK